MFSRDFSSIFDNDPFFEGHQKHMKEMNKFFSDPSQAFHEPLRIGDSSGGRRRRGEGPEAGWGGSRDEGANQSLFDFGGFSSVFHSMQDVMGNMHQNCEKAASNPEGHMLSHSSFASYSNTGEGSEPKVFQASASTRQAPGGVRETRKTLRDSVSGREKMAIGRYIGDKGRVIQRERRSGKEEENQEYVNLGKEECSEFDRQWNDRTTGQREGPVDRGPRGTDREHRRSRAVKF